jgi:hypothetical protein
VVDEGVLGRVVVLVLAKRPLVDDGIVASVLEERGLRIEWVSPMHVGHAMHVMPIASLRKKPLAGVGWDVGYCGNRPGCVWLRIFWHSGCSGKSKTPPAAIGQFNDRLTVMNGSMTSHYACQSARFFAADIVDTTHTTDVDTSDLLRAVWPADVDATLGEGRGIDAEGRQGGEERRESDE